MLTINWNNGQPERAYHLENPRPQTQQLRLDQPAAALLIADGSTLYRCDLFSAASPDRLEHAAATGSIFRPVCEARLYLRNRATGRHSRLEAAAFVRQSGIIDELVGTDP